MATAEILETPSSDYEGTTAPQDHQSLMDLHCKMEDMHHVRQANLNNLQVNARILQLRARAEKEIARIIPSQKNPHEHPRSMRELQTIIANHVQGNEDQLA